MINNLIINSFVVFSLTLILTKAKILTSKRKFIEERYKLTEKPNIFHKWFHAMFVCPMCSGFWISLFIAFFYPVYSLLVDTLVMFGCNWIIHCVEECLYGIAQFFEQNKKQQKKS